MKFSTLFTKSVSILLLLALMPTIQSCDDENGREITSLPNSKWKLYKSNHSLYDGEFYMSFTTDKQQEWSYVADSDCIEYEGETLYKVEYGLLKTWDAEIGGYDLGVEFRIMDNILYIDSINIGSIKVGVFAEYKYNNFDETKFKLCE